MKFLLPVTIASSAFSVAATAKSVADIRKDTATPVQLFYIPIPEKDAFDQAFKPTNSGASGPVTTIISLAISTDNTVVWYDHWEDGYETDVLKPNKKSTEVWGDGDISNGCAFGMPCKKDSDDVLVAGQSIVIENDIPLNHHTKKASMLYDGRDKIQASYHIAITRGSYPEKPGAYMAGAVEVVDTGTWGTSFEAPFGSVLNKNSDQSRKAAYEKTVVFVMATKDGTKVQAKGKTVTLDEGESHFVVVNQGDKVTSSEKVQADIVTSDLGSTYELRWYSLIATEYWSGKYITPMGDSTAKTRVVLYNPLSNKHTIKVKTPSKTYNVEVPGKSSKMTEPIKTGEGAIIESATGKDFIAMSQTDTVSSGDNNDWGFPLIPFDQLTTQALIGWGYGCKGKTCSGKNRLNQAGSRSVVYVSCVENCDIYVDTDNNGTHDLKFSNVKPIRSTRIVDPKDHDMSGAIIWATDPGKGPAGSAVRIAAAWGQDPERSYGGDQEALDLGTVVLPFAAVKVSETVKLLTDKDKNGVISAGDVLEYTIRVQNMGYTDILPNAFTIKGPIEPKALTQRQYNKGTCMYDDMIGKKSKCADDSLGSKGLRNPYLLPKRGGFHDITFHATINSIDSIYRDPLPQFGQLFKGNAPPLPFSVDSKILFSADIKLLKTVHIGHNVDCSISTKGLSPTDAKLAKGLPNTPITYCYRMINTGKSYLKPYKLVDSDVGFSMNIPNVVLRPDSQKIYKYRSKIGPKDMTATAKVTANPVYFDGKPLPDMGDVTDTDAAGTAILFPDADVSIEKTVHLGHWNSCSNGDEMATGYKNEKVTYCFYVKNTGATNLHGFKVTDHLIGYSSTNSVPLLKPGSGFFLPPFKTSITKTVVSPALVTANPVYDDGKDISGMGDVQDSDGAGVALIAKQVFNCPPGGDINWISGKP